MSRQSPLSILAVLLLVVLAGCSGGGLGASDAGGGDAGGVGGSGGDADRPEGAAEATPDASEADGDELGGSARQVRGRALIRTGEVELRVDRFDRARDRVTTVADTHGGFLADTSETTHRRGNRTWTTGRFVVRVPSDSFDAAFREIRAVGTVRSADFETTDVADQLVDLNARLENLRSQRDRLRTLYDEAEDTEAVLRVEQRLSEVQEEIERLEARKRALEDRVALATITVHVAEPEPDPTPTHENLPYHETDLGSAFLASVNGVVVTVRSIAVTLAYLAPYLLAFGLPLGVASLGLYRARRGSLFER